MSRLEPSRATGRSRAGAPPRERLLLAAREVLARKGFEGLTLRAIARQAGVSHGAPLRHFPTLAALLAALAAEGFARLVASIDQAIVEATAAAAAEGRELTAIDRLVVAGDAYVDLAIDDPGVFSIIFRPERCDVDDPDYERAASRSFGQLVDLVRAAQAEGWHADQSPVLVAVVLWTSVHGTAELLLHGTLRTVIAPAGLDDLRRVARSVMFDGRVLTASDRPGAPGPPRAPGTPSETGTPRTERRG